MKALFLGLALLISVPSFAVIKNLSTVSAASPLVVGTPNSRSLSLATAYQCTNTLIPCVVTVNLTSTASITLTTGTTNTAVVTIGATSGVSGGTGTNICPYTNSQTGALVVGANLATVSTTACVMVIPAGWFFAVRQTAGTVSIASAFDQSLN